MAQRGSGGSAGPGPADPPVPGDLLIPADAPVPAEPPRAADPAGPAGSRPARARYAFRTWRRTRPFWGGLLILLAGAEILVTVRAPLPVIVHIGLQGIAGYLVPTIMVLCGVLLWASPAQRLFYSVLAVLMSLGSWITSNLGGFFLGLLLGLVGGSLAFAWTPRATPEPAQAGE